MPTTQLRPGLWDTVNQRYPGSMIHKDTFVPLTELKEPIHDCKVCFVSTSGVQPKTSLPFDTVHPIGDYSFRSFSSAIDAADLEIHQIKYPTHGANQDVNVIYPIERLRELKQEGKIGSLTTNFFSFIGYNMDPPRLEQTLAEDLADAIEAEAPDVLLAAPAWPIWHQSIALVQRAVERRGIPTISPTVALDITRHIKPPRAMFLPFMMGHHFGVPFHVELQKQIVMRLLNLVSEIKSSATIPVFEKTWAEARKEGKAIEAKV